jgi:MraZ protein
MLEIRDTNNKEFVFWASRTVAVDVDKQGRFAVPTMLQEWAHLQGDVLIVGSITHLELWNPTRFESYESDDFSGGVTF